MDNIPMSAPDISRIEQQTLSRVLQTRHLSLGPYLEQFEQAVAAYTGSRYAIAVNSGTSGLHLAVIAAGVTSGDWVITSPFSFIASANCVMYERAVPVFVDVEAATGNLDPALVAEAACDLTRGGAAAQHWLPRSLKQSSNGQPKSNIQNLKSILPVHAFGQPAEMAPLLATAQQHRLAVIEDACEAIGADYRGHRAGSLGDAAVFAFYPNKQLTTGEGGLIVTDRADWADLFRSLRNQGRDVFNAWLSHTRLGYNYRLDEMSAALGLAQMQRIDELLAKRARVAGWYDERLAGLDWVERPFIAASTSRMSWFVYVIRLKAPLLRDTVMQQLAGRGIPSRPYFTPIHLQPFYQQQFGYQRGDFPVTEHLGDVSLALPFSGVMTADQVDRVCTVLTEVAQSQAVRRPVFSAGH
ncbi:MAG: GDP-perosamine synthase [Anaerolineae bacterium]|nr:GDP-perosamine synthase [Anaerolineae bacterium]